MDVNIFEIAGQTVRRSYEGLMDAGMFAEHCLWQNLPVTPGKGDLGYAREASNDIFKAAGKALEHNDMDEAGHQLRREVYFCSLVDQLAGSGKERAAQAGLKAIAAGLPALEVIDVVKQAASARSSQGLSSPEPDATDRELKQIEDWAQKDLHSICLFHTKLKQKEAAAKAQHSPWYQTAGQLASLDLAMTDAMLKKERPADARLFYADAEQYLNAIPDSASGAVRLERMHHRVARRLAEHEDRFTGQ